jgi:hypothetical protein
VIEADDVFVVVKMLSQMLNRAPEAVVAIRGLAHGLIARIVTALFGDLAFKRQ